MRDLPQRDDYETIEDYAEALRKAWFLNRATAHNLDYQLKVIERLREQNEAIIILHNG